MAMLDALKPPANHGMRVLDRSKFSVHVPLLMAQLNPQILGKIGKIAAPGELLELKGVNRVIALSPSNNKKKGLLLGRRIERPQQLSEKLTEALKEADTQYTNYTLQLDYSHWTSEEILESVFPKSEFGDPPSGFAIVGHIAHLNLRDPFLQYKNLIGEVILDKNPGVKTVVNKLDTIDTVFRTFDMEVIAGEPEFNVEQHESGCRFQFDFRKVYWNSRLHSEHERLVRQFAPDEAVCDPMAGVGPFAIPAAKKGCVVYANDLNPASFSAMEHNVELNKVSALVHSYNMDGREFIRSSMKLLNELKAQGEIQVPKKRKFGKAQEYQSKPVPRYFSHYVMNLPATAIEFLDAFRGLYRGLEEQKLPMPTLNVHCFHKWSPDESEPSEEEIHAALAKRASNALGHTIDAKDISFHDVRRVSPTKEMYCISFKLPSEVAYSVS